MQSEVGEMSIMILALALAQRPTGPQVEIADPCPIFARLIAAAQERPAFASIRRALADGRPVVPGLEAPDCRVTAGDALECSPRGMGAHGFPDWHEPLSCPGLTALPRTRRAFRMAFAIAAPGGLQIAYGVHCFQCAGPGTAWFRIGRGEPEGAEE